MFIFCTCMNSDPFSSVKTCQKRILILFIVINRRVKVFHLNAFSSPVFCLWCFFVCSLATLWRWPVLYLLRSKHGQQMRSTNLCRREALVWAGSLPAWIPFHGWEHQKSSGDGKGPSSGWADSEQRELWRSATSPGEQGPGSKLCPGPRTSYNCTGWPEEKMVNYCPQSTRFNSKVLKGLKIQTTCGQFTFFSWMLMKTNLWRGASPALALLEPAQSLVSRASKRWKPLWAVAEEESQRLTKVQHVHRGSFYNPLKQFCTSDL